MDGLGTILQANNIHRIAVANWERDTQMRAANNKVKKSQGDLANWSRSLGNKKRVEAAEIEFNRKAEGLSHELRQLGKQGSALSLQVAEQMGALQGLAAFNGVGGASVDMMENLVSLQDATSQEELAQTIENMSYFGKQDMAQLMDNAYNAQDFSQTVLDLDFTKSMKPVRMKRRLGKLIGVGVASFFLGPEGGKAVADFAVGEWEATNGNYTDAMKNFGSAIQSGMNAWKETSERGDTYGGDIMKGMRKKNNANITTDVTKKSTSSAEAGKKKSWFKR